MPVRWLFLDMNAFFASVEQQERPELRGRPVAVVPVLADSTCCIAASYEAKAYGIKTGTRVPEARALCPHLHLIEAKHGPYRQYHAAIVDVVGTCLPEPKVLSVDEMVCRLWDNERCLPDALRLAEEIKMRIKREVGDWLCCSVGLSVNPFLAKVAAEMQKPNGLVVIDDDDLPRKLYRLPLRDFPGIGWRMEVRLREAGVTTTEQMCQLTHSQMRHIWGGVPGERWWRLLRGEDVLPVPTVDRTIGHSHVLPPELRSPAGAAAVARRLLEKAAERLRCSSYRAQGLTVYAQDPGGRRWERRVKFAPCRDTFRLLDCLDSLWEHPFPLIQQVGVLLDGLIAEHAVTPSLFPDDAGQRVMDTIDGINRRYGRGAISAASVLPARYAAQDKIAFAHVGAVEKHPRDNTG